MSTPHRGLPPPSAMALPSPTQPSNSSLGQLPQPWQGSEESLRTWLQTKMEEERRKAEEERTRQEQLRGETRKIELDMLREAVRAGVPSPLVPLIFTGQGHVRTASADWIGEYIAQNVALLQQGQQQLPAQHTLQQQQPPPPPPSPQGQTLRRESRSIAQIHQQPGVPTPAGPQMGPPTGVAGGPPPGYLPPYQIPGPSAPPRPGGPPQGQGQGQPSAQQSVTPLRAALPRINTTEMPIPHPQPMPTNVPIQAVGPHAAPMPPVAPQTVPPQTETAPVSQSPSIFFHHWVPPSSSGSGAPAQATASPQRQLDSPFSHHPPPNPLSSTEYTNSPKKRKTGTGQPQGQPAPPSQVASGGSQTFSPPTHHISSTATTPSRTRRGHSRHRSDTSNVNVRGFEPYARPSTRQRKSVAEGSVSEGGPPGGTTQQPPVSSAGDGGNGGGQSHLSQGQRQQSAPPPHQPQSQPRPYSAGSDFRMEPYHPPPRPPSQTEPGEAGQAKSSGT